MKYHCILCLHLVANSFSVADSCVQKQNVILVKVVCKICSVLLKESFPFALIELSKSLLKC